ncbi:MAG: di-trans,poly-cis-decaprenylcistransferase [Candidatus Magasanikbacteria bacterium]|nr:di-trans,poly-cis-decaprenylcistransferase [Candidatus Magasanikbacteria bacterium]
MTQNQLQHIAFIMDGNRRWATKRGLPKLMGHNEAAKALKKIITACHERQVSLATFWALSTENLKERSKEELANLFSLFEKVVDEIQELKEKDIRIKIIGDLTKLPEHTAKKLQEAEEETKNNAGLTVNLGINYGGRDELIRAMKKIISNGYKPEDIDEQLVEKFLDTAGMPEPELIIRTGGNFRLSGYLTWQGIYAELYFTPIQWPAFTPEELDKAIAWYREQQRNRGK